MHLIDLQVRAIKLQRKSALKSHKYYVLSLYKRKSVQNRNKPTIITELELNLQNISISIVVVSTKYR